MKKVFTLSILSLFASVSMVAQSTENPTSAELKKQTEIIPVVKIDKSKISPVVKINKEMNKTVQPVKKEEEIKSIETKQK